jgi:hypothetical protein
VTYQFEAVRKDENGQDQYQTITVDVKTWEGLFVANGLAWDQAKPQGWKLTGYYIIVKGVA